MPDFSKAKIYKLVSNKSSDVYIGSCIIELSKRFSVHKCKSNTCISKSMFINDAIITIVLIENYPCLCKNEMKARELHYITTLECINKNKPFVCDINYSDYKEWQKQYQLEHKEQIKQYRVENVDNITQQIKQYQLVHVEDIKQYEKQYYINHKEEIKQHNKQYRLDHAEDIKQYRLNHKEELKQYNKQRYLNKKAQQLTNCINNITN